MRARVYGFGRGQGVSMPTNGKCIRCGYRAPVSCFLEAAGDGEILAEYIKLPHAVQAPFFKYLSLFRPASGCSCQQSKIVRLIREMIGLLATGHVAHPKKGRVDRPCSPHVWAQGMERMIEQSATLDLPLDNHNYLRAVVWQMADQADAKQEQRQHQQILTGNAQANRDFQPPIVQVSSDNEELSEIERKYIEKYGRKGEVSGMSAGTEAVNNLANAWKKRDGGQ